MSKNKNSNELERFRSRSRNIYNGILKTKLQGVMRVMCRFVRQEPPQVSVLSRYITL